MATNRSAIRPITHATELIKEPVPCPSWPPYIHVFCFRTKLPALLYHWNSFVARRHVHNPNGGFVVLQRTDFSEDDADTIDIQ